MAKCGIMMPREATTNTVAGSGWEAVVKAKGRVAEFATVAAGEFATHCDARIAENSPAAEEHEFSRQSQ